MTVPASLSHRGTPNMIATQLFGELEVGDDQLVTMPDGLFGFPECRSFALLPAGREGFFWLQSTDHTTLAFLLVDPFLYFEGYTVDLTGPVLQRLGTSEPAHVNVFAIVTLPGSGGDATANLQGPVVLNVESHRGFQAVLQDSEYGTRETIRLEQGAAR